MENEENKTENPVETPENPPETPENPPEAPENPGETPENPPETPENPPETPENPPETPENPPETPEGPGWIAPERMETLLAYCKLSELRDDPEVMALIPELYLYAIQYLAGAGIGQPEKDAPWRAQYDLCVNYLVLSAYEQRNSSIVGITLIENPLFRQALIQLKMMNPSWTP